MKKIQRALISVYNKSQIAEFAAKLSEHNVSIISTGNTARTLTEAGLTVTSISDVTGFEEILGGRVKTLHPKVHGGILARLDDASHSAQLEKHGIQPIDLVVVNLYPFQETIRKPDVTLADAIENIDIGGPCMLRAAAKNFERVTVVVDPDDYELVLREMAENGGAVTDTTRQALALKAIKHTRNYDMAIADYLAQISSERQEDLLSQETIQITASQPKNLRYGENPHQRGYLYTINDAPYPSVLKGDVLHGKAISFNNLIDLNAAWNLVLEFDEPAAAIIKHTNPCGAAVGADISLALVKAHESDPLSAFGGIVALNRPIDLDLAVKLNKLGFIECIIAPSYNEDALIKLKKKKDRRLVAMGTIPERSALYKYDVKFIPGGLLIQDADLQPEEFDKWETVTERKPTDVELANLKFAWTVCKHVKSNSIVYVKDFATVGVGAGQMSRVDSSEIAAKKAGDKANGAVMASDAFFPFRDGIDAAAKVGITAVIEPGGSIRDAEVIEACNEHNIAMIFTKRRHFKH